MIRTIPSVMRPVALVAALCACSFFGILDAAPKSPSAKKAEEFIHGVPFTFEQVLKLAGQDAIPLHRRKEAILNRGVDFSLSNRQIEQLKAAGASDELLKAIRSKSKPVVVVAAAPPPPKKDPVGTAALTCAPVDCEITLNGIVLGPTQGGKMEISKRPGKWVIDFNAKGYIGKQVTITVDADRTVPVGAVLEPNRATQEAFGEDLLKKVIQAVGGDDGLQPLTTVQATGSITIWSREGSSVRWTLLMRNNPDRALFQAQSGKLLHEVEFVGSEFKASKNLKGQDALDLPTDVGFIRDYQLAAILAKVSDPQFKKIANQTHAGSEDEYPLVADNGTQKFSFALDSELRPQKVQITTATGVGSAIIAYSDYFKKDKTSYPKTVQIKPDGWQHGIEVHFDNVELSPKLNASDYHLRGKALLNLGN